VSIFGFEMSAPEVSRKRAWPWFLALIGIILFGMWFLARTLQPAPDYAGVGEGQVTIEIVSGQTLTQIGQTLLDADVIASLDAWLGVVTNNEAATSISPGKYEIGTRMSAASALDALLSPDSRAVEKVTIREGLRLSEVLDLLADKTGISRKQFVQALKDPVGIELSEYAEGKPEGFLFPATYEYSEDDSAKDILRMMAKRWSQMAEEIELARRSRLLGYSVLEVVTIASILEVEAGVEDYSKVARVIENRLEFPMRLQLDSTVNYALGIKDLQLNTEQMNVESAYNTYNVDGLPPGPIGNPGQTAIEAALEPAVGDWLYFVTVDPATKLTKFAVTYEDFLALKREFQANVG
jgi:UPF0755 protein